MVREGRTIEVRIISATDLKRVKKFGGEQICYAVAYIYPAQKQTTAADPHGGTNPTWNATLQFTCYEIDLHRDTSNRNKAASQNLNVEIYSQGGRIFHSSDKLVGTVTIPLQDVAAGGTARGAMRTYEVRLPSRKVRGTLELSVKLGDKRELREGEEDLTAAPLPSLSDCQENDNLTKPTAWVTGGTFAEKSDGTVTGLPAQRYSFAPLGKLPVENQSEEQGPDRSSHGSDAARLLDTTGQQRPLKPIRGGIRARTEQRSGGQRNGEHSIDGFPGKRNHYVRGGLIVVGRVLQVIVEVAAAANS